MPTTPVNAMILTFRHHCCLLTDRAPRLKAYAWPANVSVLSTRRSSRSPRCRIESMFCTMISFLSRQLRLWRDSRQQQERRGGGRRGRDRSADVPDHGETSTDTLSRSDRACLRGSAGGAVVYWCISYTSAHLELKKFRAAEHTLANSGSNSSSE